MIFSSPKFATVYTDNLSGCSVVSDGQRSPKFKQWRDTVSGTSKLDDKFANLGHSEAVCLREVSSRFFLRRRVVAGRATDRGPRHSSTSRTSRGADNWNVTPAPRRQASSTIERRHRLARVTVANESEPKIIINNTINLF